LNVFLEMQLAKIRRMTSKPKRRRRGNVRLRHGALPAVSAKSILIFPSLVSRCFCFSDCCCCCCCCCCCRYWCWRHTSAPTWLHRSAITRLHNAINQRSSFESTHEEWNNGKPLHTFAITFLRGDKPAALLFSGNSARRFLHANQRIADSANSPLTWLLSP